MVSKYMHLCPTVGEHGHGAKVKVQLHGVHAAWWAAASFELASCGTNRTARVHPCQALASSASNASPTPQPPPPTPNLPHMLTPSAGPQQPPHQQYLGGGQRQHGSSAAFPHPPNQKTNRQSPWWRAATAWPWPAPPPACQTRGRPGPWGSRAPRTSPRHRTTRRACAPH